MALFAAAQQFGRFRSEADIEARSPSRIYEYTAKALQHRRREARMDFEQICQIVDTVVDLSAPNKRALLRDLAHRAALVLKVDDDVVFNALLKREELGSTGVGNAVALPHVRLERVKKPFGILARLKQPIDFDAIDGQPVDLVCLLLLSKENEQAQLNVLAAVARKLRTPELLEQLRGAPNRVVLYNVMVGRTGVYRSQ
jgi:nitrogen PTS system EIIA component